MYATATLVVACLYDQIAEGCAGLLEDALATASKGENEKMVNDGIKGITLFFNGCEGAELHEGGRTVKYHAADAFTAAGGVGGGAGGEALQSEWTQCDADR